MLKKMFSLFFLALVFNCVFSMDEQTTKLWNDVFRYRSFISPLNKEIGFLSEEDRKAVCAHLDPDAMAPVLEKTRDIGRRFIKEHKTEDAEVILITLLIPNAVFNTCGHYEGYICDEEEYDWKCTSFQEFADRIKEISRPLFLQLWKEFCAENNGAPDLVSELKTCLRQIDPMIE